MLKTDMAGILSGCTDMVVIDDDDDGEKKKAKKGKKSLKLQKKASTEKKDEASAKDVRILRKRKKTLVLFVFLELV